MDEAQISEDQLLMESIKKHTGFDCEVVDEEIIVKPELISKLFLSRLFDALLDTRHTFIINKNLEVVFFKP